MSVVSSEVYLSSSHSYRRTETTSERLQISARSRATPADSAANRGQEQRGRVLISLQGQARAAAEMAANAGQDQAVKEEGSAETLEAAAEEARKDPVNQLLIALVEYLSGRSLRLVDSEDFQPDQQAAAEPAAIEGKEKHVEVPEPARQPDFSLRYQRRYALEEHEATTFSARGVIRTADGATVRFDLQLEMQRSYREESHLDIRMGTAAQREDPLVINFSGTAAQLRDQRFQFDLNADGEQSALPLLANGSGYLAFDRNGDGRVNDGSELFGALSGDGYADLKALDADGNGWLDAADKASEQLYLWLPEAGGDGKLLTLEEAGIAAISSANIATPFELRGQHNADLGAVRATGLYLSTENQVGTTQQIDLSV